MAERTPEYRQRTKNNLKKQTIQARERSETSFLDTLMTASGFWLCLAAIESFPTIAL